MPRGNGFHKISFGWAWAPARLKAEFPPRRDFLGSNVCYAGGRIYLDGYTGEGKSMFSLGMAQAIADGKSFGPWSGSQECTRVLYLDYEMGREEMKKRLGFFGSSSLAVVCFDDPELNGDGLKPIDTPEGQEQVARIVNDLECQVIFVDNLYAACEGSLMGGADKAGGWQAHERIVPWAKEMSKYDKLTIWLQHSNESGKAYGDKRIARQMYLHLHLDRIAPLDELNLKITVEKNRGGGKPKPWHMSWRERQGWTLNKTAVTAKRDMSGHLSLFLCTLNDVPPVEWPNHPDVPRNASPREITEVRRVFYERMGGTPESCRRAFSRCMDVCQKRRLVVRCQSWIWAIE